jgi:hypothetical protein
VRTVKALVLVGFVILAACTTSEERKEVETAKVKKNVAHEIARICALPHPARDEELKKLKERTGMELYCATK